MTFLKRYSYSAIGLNYFTSTMVVMSSIVAIGFTQQIATGPKRCGHNALFSFDLLLPTYSHVFSNNRNGPVWSLSAGRLLAGHGLSWTCRC